MEHNDPFTQRLKNLQNALRQVNGCAIICGNPNCVKSEDQSFIYRNSNFFYFTGSKSQNFGILVCPDKIFCFEWLKKNPVWETTDESLQNFSQRLKLKKIASDSVYDLIRGFSTIFFESNARGFAGELRQKLLVEPFAKLWKKAKSLQPLEFLVAPMREIKSRQEISTIWECANICKKVYEEFKRIVKPGMTEERMSFILRSLMYQYEAEPAFEPIVAAGVNAATLHHCPTTKVWRKEEPLLIDFGVLFKEYTCDVTRMLFCMKKHPLKAIYLVVKTVNEELISLLKPDLSFDEVQSITSKLLAERLSRVGLRIRKISNFFPHSWGHSIGLDVHDPSFLRVEAGYKLRENMVVTVEPGLYSKKIFKSGIRIEDTVLVKKEGAVNMTSQISKEFEDSLI